MTTEGPQAVCVYCGNDRPVNQPTCPTCGRGWVDSLIAPPETSAQPDEPATPALAPPFAAIEHDVPEPIRVPEPPRRKIWPIVAALAILVGVVYAGIFALVLSSDDTDLVGTTVTTATTLTVTQTTAPPRATTTTTTATTTTTTTPITTLPPIEPIGDPLPVRELGLGAFAIGPLDFGETRTQAVGTLVGTFGQPDAIQEGSVDWGLCEGDVGSVVTWGPFNAIFKEIDGAEFLIGYRLIGSADMTDHPAMGLTTLSGLQVGDSNGELAVIYSSFEIDYVTVVDETVFRLTRNSDGALLLWGPVANDATVSAVEGIYSPRPCDGGP